MPTWNSRGLRGSTLEDLLNRTNEKYAHNGLALIQKIPTPITPINIDKETYFEQKSTVDYIGAVQGIPVCFDAKECNTDTFPLANVHPHQVAFMEQFEKQEGIAFLLISFTHREEFYYLRFSDLEKFWNRALDGGRKSFRSGLFSAKGIRGTDSLSSGSPEGFRGQGLTIFGIFLIIALFHVLPNYHGITLK
mgnify:CR=1 FL=1